MSCPQCGNGEIDSAGVCLNCGFQASDALASKSELKDESASNSTDAKEGADSDGASEAPLPEDLPEWRKELAQRFQEIKQKRESKGTTYAASTVRETPALAPAPKKVDEASAALRAELLERMKTRKPAPKPPTLVPLQKTLQPLESPRAVQPIFSSTSPNPQNVQNLIDTVISRKAVASENAEEATDSLIYISDEESDSDHAADSEGKLILLSRTLSGLVDLILVVLFAGIFIVMADHFWGIRVVDLVSIIHFSVLFLLIYFVYSLFFLASANQTIGMMITELRVVGVDAQRPLLRQLVGRCCCFLVSLFGLGIGLLWSLFSRENLCFHDRVSGTHVIRI
jgi:uncharacterized RDD family membrane protein YckC